MVERRRYERFKLNLSAEVVCHHEGRRLSEKVLLINIGAGGAYFPIGECIAPGEELELVISAPEGKFFKGPDWGSGLRGSNVNFETRGVVMRAEQKPEHGKDYCLAVKFIGPIRFATNEHENRN